MKVTRNYYEIQPRRRQHQTFMRKEEVTLEEVKTPVTMFLDQASNGGYSLYDADSRLFMSGVFKRGNTKLPEFKENFIKYISDLADKYKVDTIFYEEVFDSANMITTEVLFYLKHAIKDLGYFRGDIEVLGLSHKTWKSNMAKPDTFKFGKDDKKEVRKWVQEIFPLIGVTVQDELDAIGMGIAVMIKGKGKQNFYKQAKYNKRLPVHFQIFEDNLIGESELEGNDVEQEMEEYEELKKQREKEIVKKLRKPFRLAYEAGGMVELELNKRSGIENIYRRFLSHKDVLTYIRIPPDYKNWGMIILENGETPERFETSENKNGGYLLFCARKKRL